MKQLRMAAWWCAGILLASPASAQTFGQYSGAETLPVNGRMFGAYLQSSENVFGLLGQLRLSFYPSVDFGFRGGFARQDFVGGNRTTVRMGADLKINVSHQSEQNPVALAVGGDLSVETGDDYSVLSVGPTVVASRDFGGSQISMTPYASVGLAFASVDIGGGSDTDVSVPVRLGGVFRTSPQLNFVAELQLHLWDSFNDDVGFAAGVNLPF